MNQTRRRLLIRESCASVVLFLAALGFFWPILFTPDAWKPAGGGDLVSFLYPSYRFAAASLRAGNLPLWNPHLYGGAPFLADMQTGLFYPPNLLLFFLAPNFSYKAMEWLVVLHVFLAGLFMYLCLRYLTARDENLARSRRTRRLALCQSPLGSIGDSRRKGADHNPRRAGRYFQGKFFTPLRSVQNDMERLRRPAALLGAVTYMFSGLFILHFGNLNLVAVAAWLPLIFLLFWRALWSRSLGWAVAAGLALGVATLAGHLQITLYIALTLTLTTTFHSLFAIRHSPFAIRYSPFAILLITALVAVGLAALVLLPAFEYAALSPRAALSYQDAARYSLIPGLLGEMLVPALFSSREPSLYWGVWDRVAVGYVSLLALLLAGLAVLLRRGRRVEALVALAVVAFLLALGGQSVFHGWAYRLLPGFGQLRAPARLVFVVSFALAALAALGLDRLLRPLDRRARRTLDEAWRGLLWFGGAATLVGGAWAYLVIYQAADRDPVVFWRVSMASSGVIFALLLGWAGMAWLAARRSGRLRRSVLSWLAVGLVFVDLASVGAYADLGHEPPTAGYDHPLAVHYLQTAPGFFRIDSRTDAADLWQPDLALLPVLSGKAGAGAGLYDVNGVDNPLVVADMARFWEGTGGRSTRLYDLLGVRYVVASKDVVLDWNKFSLAFDGDPTVNVYWNKSPLPRAFVVHRAVVADDHEEAWTRLHAPDFDPVTTVVLEGGQELDIPAAEPATVEVLRYETNKIEIAVDNPAAGYLFLSDPFYPGWQAQVDGKAAAVLRADYAFRAVALPPGEHVVTMTFQPGTWRLGLAISLLTVLIVLVLGGLELLRRSKKWENPRS